MQPAAWTKLFPEEFEPVVLSVISYWSRRGFAAGRASCGCTESLVELRRLDPDAARFLEDMAAELDTVPASERNRNAP